MKVECVCGKWHEVTPTGLALIVFAYQRGDLHTQTRLGPTAMCMAEAFEDKALVEMFIRRYPGNIVGISKGVGSARTTEDEKGSAQEVQQRARQRGSGGKLEAGTGTKGSQEAGSEGSRGPKQVA